MGAAQTKAQNEYGSDIQGVDLIDLIATKYILTQNFQDMKKLTQKEHQLIYILGFDFIGNQDGILNNIYGDTPNYKKNTDVATYHGNWNRQTSIVLQKNGLKRFVRVIPEGTHVFEAKDLKKYTNYSEITVQEFKRRYHL